MTINEFNFAGKKAIVRVDLSTNSTLPVRRQSYV